MLPLRTLCSGSLAVAAALANPAVAQVAASIEGGTTGVGTHLSVPIRDDVEARFGLNALDYSFSTRISNLNYDIDLHLRVADALLDWFPMDSGFRLSGGFAYDGNKVDAHGRPDAGTFRFNRKTYDTSVVGTVIGRVQYRRFAPYLGIGWGHATRSSGWTFAADLGVLFHGAPRTSLVAANCKAPRPVCIGLYQDVDAERQSLDQQARDLAVFPVIRAGASYRF